MQNFQTNMSATSDARHRVGSEGLSHEERRLTEVKLLLDAREKRLNEDIRQTRAVEQLLLQWRPGMACGGAVPSGTAATPVLEASGTWPFGVAEPIAAAPMVQYMPWVPAPGMYAPRGAWGADPGIAE